jgi:hypothetical protein
MEIDSDLWEQAQDAETGLEDGPPFAAHLLIRWLLGLPDDLLWRLAHIRTRDEDKKSPMLQAKDNRAMTVAMGVIATFVLGLLIINTVVGEIGYYRQTDFAYYVHHGTMMSVYGPIGLAAIGGGFWFMHQAPMLCALLVTAGSVDLAILAFWLVVPELIAAGIYFYAFRRARRIQADG